MPRDKNEKAAAKWRQGLMADIKGVEELRNRVYVDLDVEIERIRQSVPELSFELELVTN